MFAVLNSCANLFSRKPLRMNMKCEVFGDLARNFYTKIPLKTQVFAWILDDAPDVLLCPSEQVEVLVSTAYSVQPDIGTAAVVA